MSHMQLYVSCRPAAYLSISTCAAEELTSFGCACDLAAANLTSEYHRARFTLQVQSQCLGPTNQLLCQTWNQLAEVLEAIGSLEEALTYCKKVADMLYSTYPSNSTAVAFQRLRLSNLLRRLGEGTKADSECLQAMEILHLHYGASFEA